MTALRLAALALLLAGHALGAQAPRPPADLVFRGGTVYTASDGTPSARAVAVRGGRIVFVGSEEGVARWLGAGTRVVDLQGGMLLPGFHDSHVHPAESGVELGECDLSADSTRSLVVAHIASCAREQRGPWFRGHGWQLPVFPEANPDRALLDSLVPERPAFLTAADGHSAWVNSRALARAGLTSASVDPPRGRIERDAAGAPRGTLREAAVNLVARHLPRYTTAERIAGARRALALANSFGITSVQEASAGADALAAYAALDRRGALTARVAVALHVDPAAAIGPEVARLQKMRAPYAGTPRRRLRVIAAKIFADGVIEARTAALLEPYAGTDDRGPANLTAARLDSLVIALDRARFQVHVHAIGDRAVRMTLDAMAAARAANGPRDARHHIAHLEMIDTLDVPRFRTLGVFANFQPLWAYRDSYVRDLTEPVLGPERAGRLYPIGSVWRSGAVVVAGSDWSVSSMDPLAAIQVAVTRRDPLAAAGPAWLPEQTITLAEALTAYTINGARVNFEERETGSIEVGKAADLVVLDEDLFAIPAERIHAARVRYTFLAGREVYAAPR